MNDFLFLFTEYFRFLFTIQFNPNRKWLNADWMFTIILNLWRQTIFWQIGSSYRKTHDLRVSYFGYIYFIFFLFKNNGTLFANSQAIIFWKWKFDLNFFYLCCFSVNSLIQEETFNTFILKNTHTAKRLCSREWRVLFEHTQKKTIRTNSSSLLVMFFFSLLLNVYEHVK